MSVVEPDPDPDLVRIGQSPEWIKWFEEALAYFEDQRLPREDRNSGPWRPVGIQSGSLTSITMFDEKAHVRDEKAHVRDDLVPLVRASVREYSISHYPWDFKA